MSNFVSRTVKRATNPIATVNKTLKINIPTEVKIGSTKIGLDPGKQVQTSVQEVKKIGRQAETDWRNAGRGEIGNYIAKTAEGAYGVVATIPRAISSGNWEKELQRGYGNSRMALSPIENSIGKSNSWQTFLRDENLNKNTFGTAKNFAGQTRGHSTMQSSGFISNEDRVQWQQLSVKAAAVVGAIFGGAALAGGGAVPAGGAGAGAAGTGSSALTMPALGSSYGYGASATYGLGSSAASVGAAASGGSWLATAGQIGAGGGLLYSALTGRPAPASIGDIFTGGGINPDQGGGLLDPIWDLIQGGREPAASVYNEAAPSALSGILPQTDEGKALLWAGVALVAGYYLWRRF
ncbi:MAG: hypothetical protein HC883_01075 [Bdellovibrionaceae bacterium]|nr:hypothetical protein [Pseudobdellovibrionaceae bacterium]